MADATATAPEAISCNNTNAMVILNGSRSHDPDADPLQYFWYRNGTAGVFATGAVAAVVLPVGSNSITLRVSDSFAASDQIITVKVITAADAVERLMGQVSAHVPKDRPLNATLSAALAGIHRGHNTAAIAELRAFQFEVRVLVARQDPVLARTLASASQDIIIALERCCCGHETGHEQITPVILSDNRASAAFER